jgi:hypothetical protein
VGIGCSVGGAGGVVGSGDGSPGIGVGVSVGVSPTGTVGVVGSVVGMPGMEGIGSQPPINREAKKQMIHSPTRTSKTSKIRRKILLLLLGASSSSIISSSATSRLAAMGTLLGDFSRISSPKFLRVPRELPAVGRNSKWEVNFGCLFAF